ncbi:hypothetical protein A8C56_09150 [Niabella ginsenosidivorans]|uniref:Carbohydrate-binding domain-containing protein n=1 Tax=Niabella ginsenosidivorans TaxID=1176587 RepID=A0A1A9I3H8_9BACT|nr:carbohydrate-binding domain-containing protein [Niabella ginsenosidivorans]ANH81124.1 hypothetical protein A8C56_09150 [Niabella ginsenosidivorans]
MPKRKWTLLLLVISVSVLIGCSKSDLTGSSSDTGSSGTTGGTITIDSTSNSGTAEGSADSAYNADDLVENSTFSHTVSIVFGTTTVINNPLAGSGVSIAQSGDAIVITSTVKEVAYELSGTTANGSVKIYSDNKFRLTLNGVSITSADGPAINIQSGKRAFIVLAANTTNTLTDGSTYAAGAEDMKGAFFSEGQLIFSGTGSLTVKGNYKHGICSDDYIRVRSGTITVTGAVSDGIHTNDAFIADGGTLTITADSDGIECDEGSIVINNGILTIHAGDDGITASYNTDNTIDPYVTINGGTMTITTSAGEGIESKSTLTINNGTISVTTVDDGLNAGSKININGGYIYASSSSNDGIDSNGPMTVTGGRIVAIGAAAPEEGFDCDQNTFKITGGTLVGIGGATSSPTASASTQYSAILGGASASQIYHIESAGGAEALTFLAPKTYTTLLFSGAKLKANTSYVIYTGGSVANGTSFHGLYTSGTYTRGTKGSSFTTSSIVTNEGGSTGPGGGR